jgi:hypothetical protein
MGHPLIVVDLLWEYWHGVSVALVGVSGRLILFLFASLGGGLIRYVAPCIVL